MNRQVFSLIALMIIYSLVAGNAAGQEVITLGTMATEMSDWGRIFIEMNARLMAESRRQLRFQFYWGISEERLIRSVKSGSLDAVSLTGTGSGNILPEAFIFQLPMLFSGYEQLDYVRDGLTSRFEEKFAEKDYILLGWGDLGFIHLFSTEPIRTQSDLQQTKVWAWDIDSIGKELIAASGISPVLLPIQTVLSSLKSGDVETVYTSPLGCLAFGWQTEVRYMSTFPDFHLAAGIGATIMSKDRYDELSEDHKTLLERITREYHEELIQTIRQKNRASLGTLAQNGIEVIQITSAEQAQWKEVAQDVRNGFADVLFPQDLLDAVDNLLQQFQANQ